MIYDYFLASRFRNKDFVLPFAKNIRAKGKSVYCFIESEASRTQVGELDVDAEAAMKGFEEIPDWQTSPAVKEVFETDMSALRDSEALILLLPAGKSCHIEAGVAYGLGKKLIVIGEQKETESLYLIFNEFFDTIEDFLKSI